MRDDMTTAEAEAWADGWRAACRAMADALSAQAKVCADDGFPRDAEALWQARDAVRNLTPPAPPARTRLGILGEG